MRARWIRLFVALLGAVLTLSAFWLLERPYRAEALPPWPTRRAAPEPAQVTDADVPSDAGSGQDAAPLQAPAQIRPIALKTPGMLRKSENYVLAGLDRKYGVRRGGRTDTLMVAAFHEDSGHLGVISIPRDLWVELPNGEFNRINAVYGTAHRAGYDPIDALERVIENTLGIPVAHTIVIDLDVFERVIDAVDGVTVDVPCPIVDDFLDPRVDGGRRVLRLEAGAQRLDGPTAAMFIRSRHGRSDFGRTRRQQRVLDALHAKLGNFDGVTRAPSVLSTVEDSIKTDLSRLQLLNLARRVLRLPREHIHGAVIGHKEVKAHRTDHNWSVLLPEPEALEQRLEGLFRGPSPGARPASMPCPDAEVALKRSRKKGSSSSKNE